ncbi:1,6-anhydro-N-acetylmuramyl-L-alanine amidase AmpD [Candidatus Persebacteraceae bacterium Df01]|jgi:AmpD protein|uniref:1,6-anhydro-N-acetylmuramyl-L-alanine amidase AmpD n=1 Tax=Candidatus Doriopsillibacter californiensis TaxID=2970740 RepID=A0ABT7QJN6_9GAMM|nr:1,6-anhydro-N-acetylmuramyl-L-alanine amidase AmpD [Candidatus Persebacteraceae bacterium Df01]
MNLDNNGWMSDTVHLYSPNQDDRSDKAVRLLVVHGISLPPGMFDGDAIEHLFRNTLDCDSHPFYNTLRNLRVSAHFLLRRDGQLTQFVSCNRRAWHAGESCWRGKTKVNDFSIGVELEGTDDIPYETVQYTKLTTLIQSLAACYTPLAVAGHEHIAPKRKTDPGPAFDWEKLFKLIGTHCDGRP